MEIVKVNIDHPVRHSLVLSLLVVTLLVAMASCKANTPPQSTSTRIFSPTSSNTLTVTATYTPVPPTPTLEPMAAIVNGEGVLLSDFQAELAQYQAALSSTGKPAPSDANQKQIVLDDLINQVLLAQAAKAAGYSISPQQLQSRITQLAANSGGADGLAAWEKQNGYSDQSFQLSLARSIAAAWQRDQIISAVPKTAPQVHAWQIRVNTQAEAQSVLAKLKAGVQFATMAYYYNRDTGGDLGWFPRGYLTVPEVENAAFALKPGDYSDIIQSSQGFHIIQVLESDPNHPLSADARLVLQTKALNKWVADHRAQSKITVLVP